MLEIDFPRDIPQSDEVKIYNRKLLESFQIPGFPTILLLDEDGREINRTGYQPGGADKYVEHISELIGKSI
jgi:protein disulfide-isomerase